MTADRETIDLVVNYMKYRNSHRHGYLKYYYFKQIIRYITDEKDGMKVRAIFQRLIDDGIIHRKQLMRGAKKIGLLYLFNPYETEALDFEYI